MIGSQDLYLRCTRCGRQEPWPTLSWHCPACGGPFEFAGPPVSNPFNPDWIQSDQTGLARYAAFLPPVGDTPITLGEGWTPLLSDSFEGYSVHWKLEFMAPTGSYKDRGVALMVSTLATQGVTTVCDDSSGNAGASLAAYAARASVQATIFTPAYASPAKRAQIAVYGATLVPVPGPREEATRAAHRAVEEGMTYASHNWHPAMLVGLQTIAWEVWEQMGRQGPDWFVLPVGHGSLLLGAHRGFQRLLTADLIERLPRLVAVQAEPVAPLYAAFHAGLDEIPAVPSGHTVAEGIAINQPVRGPALLQALRESNGTVLQVSDQATLQAQQLLARRGLYVEPTAAAAVAGLQQLIKQVKPHEVVVVPLTGSGLKGVPS